MHAILTPVGSAGDVNPFVALGHELCRRGHRVTILGPEPFDTGVTDAGLHFVPIWSADEFERTTANPDLWHPRRGPAVVLETVAAHLRSSYAALEAVYDPGETVLVGHPLSFFTRVFEEVHHVPAVTIDLAPSTLRSASGPAALPGRDLSSWPAWIRRALWWGLDRFAIDPLIAPALNRWRAELHLQPVSGIFKSWMHSPQRIIGLFPDWFGEPQPDWPHHVRLAGFVLNQDDRSLPAALQQFLDDGEPPIVFTPGSANRHAARFFQTAIDAAARTGRRALLVTSYAEHLPSSLPQHVYRAAYTSFSALFPRAAAVVHHGGIGTCAQGLAAGVPQMIMPMGFDQFDNALRLTRLGVGASIPPERFVSETVAPALERLLTREDVIGACRRWRLEVDSAAALTRACDLIEATFSENRRS